ncbi:hypothetical protein [Natranaerobius thermophilus]|uniref:Uncharacterized protein n=1 Tax=Natranaerobius thermophilus (strain ATCC BAA-1301 / DSM 18059 / JW/NM-WN-LF) TaxID=457570 RepID=B2A7Q5_NATTJ|nr:hypothetical protein [Natranaerobius thermophilus]ACB84357.1 hypothetical protein Nther_0770 [Natranaerobius thermophilus JW/NM-WN-LF]
MNSSNLPVGLICSGVLLVTYIILIYNIVLHLPNKLDTFIVLSWLFIPGIIGGGIFHLMDVTGKWDS